jgi:hypothetical protein
MEKVRYYLDYLFILQFPQGKVASSNRCYEFVFFANSKKVELIEENIKLFGDIILVN